tara:strand:- start:1784 stop:2326 length:543 start_codon:yes stop_codon:yes gene_type:complete
MNIFFDLKKLKHLGKNVIIGKTVRIRRPELVEIGDNTIIDDFCYISTPLKIGRNCHISSGVKINGGGTKLIIGDFVEIGANTVISTVSSDYINPSISSAAINKKFHFGTIKEKISIRNHVSIGSLSLVLPGVNLPEGSAFAAMTVIRKKKYKKWSLYAGYNADYLLTRNGEKYLKKIKKI